MIPKRLERLTIWAAPLIRNWGRNTRTIETGADELIRHDPVELVSRRMLERPCKRDARIIDQYRRRPEIGADSMRQLPDRNLIGEIHNVIFNLTSAPPRSTSARFAPFARQLLCPCRPNPTGCRCQHNNMISKDEGHREIPLSF
jgi:hypothetical protein